MSRFFDESGEAALQKLPEYTYVPGVTPHPVSDRGGHAFGLARPEAQRSLQGGRVLFNSGYYWEAHEVWEAEWLAAGRTGPAADLIKGLIKLAACGVKCLERNREGAVRHARRAGELIRQSAAGRDQATSEPTDFILALTRQLTNDPPIATLEQQQQAGQGGVPLLGLLPEIRLSELLSQREKQALPCIPTQSPDDKPAAGGQ